jgi:hypothetical protein
MRAMTPETLQKILEDAPGLTKIGGGKGDKTEPGWAVEAEHRATLYLAFEGASTQVAEVAKITPRASHLRVETKDRTIHLFPVELVQSISVRPPRDAGTPSRTGF